MTRRLVPPPWMLAIGLWGIAFSLACRLSPVAAQDRSAGSSLASMMLVGSQDALSDTLYEEADVYFHKGVKHVHHEAVPMGLFQKLGQSISPVAHVHAAGRGIREIMPWLRFATEVNPHNVTAYCVAAYWLAGPAEAPDQAMQVLHEGVINNTGDYRLQMELCHLLLKRQRFAEARLTLDAALRLWPSGEAPDSEQARLDKAEMLLFRALLSEMDNRKEAAANAFAGILTLFPNRTWVRDQMEALQRSERPSDLALQMLNILLRTNQHEWAEDKDEHDHHGHDDDDDHDDHDEGH